MVCPCNHRQQLSTFKIPLATFSWVVLLYAYFQSNNVSAQARFNIREFKADDHLGSVYIRDIVQDSLGFLWFRSHDDLKRFDGHAFRIFKHDPQDSLQAIGNAPSRLLAGRHGDLWICYVDISWHARELIQFDTRTQSATRHEPKISADIIRGISIDREEPAFWLGSAGGKGLYKYNYSNRRTLKYSHSAPDTLVSAQINTIYAILDQDSVLLLATGRGLWTFNKTKNQFRAVAVGDGRFDRLQSIHGFHVDRQLNEDRLWMLTTSGMVLVDSGYKITDYIAYPENLPYDRFDKWGSSWVASDQHSFWFATNGGLYRFDRQTRKYSNMPDRPCEVLFIDRDKNLWAASSIHGLGPIQLRQNDLKVHSRRTAARNRSVHLANEFNYPEGINSVYNVNTAAGDFLAVLGANNKLWTTDLTPDSLHLRPVKFNDSEKQWSNLASAWKGRKYFWVSTWGRGVIGFAVDTTNRTLKSSVKYLAHDPDNSGTIASSRTLSVAEDEQGNLWVATADGLDRILDLDNYPRDGSVIHFTQNASDPSSISSNLVIKVMPVSSGVTWVATYVGVDRFNGTYFERVFATGDLVRDICQAGDSLIIGTSRGMYFLKEKDSTFQVTEVPLVKTDVYFIAVDKLNRIWYSSQRNVYCLDPVNNVVINVSHETGLNGALAKISDGLFVCYSDMDITVFDPLSVQLSIDKYRPVLTNLKINNSPVVIGTRRAKAPQAKIPYDIAFVNELILGFDQNDLSVDFSSMELTSPESNLYRYMLDGYDERWLDSEAGSRNATYTNLDPGNYTLRIKASNRHGIWSELERQLVIRILPPPWKTWWAYSLYGVAFVSLLLLWRNYDLKRVRLKHRAEHLSELDNLKSRFFTNISHEFRTPITLILAPLKELYEKVRDPDQKNTLATMQRNGQRLLRLINQLLDLSKIEAGKMNLNIAAIDLVTFIREVASSYESLAAARNMKFFFYTELPALSAAIDEEKIEKVIHNLLSNAFKFTQDGGQVIISLRIGEKDTALIIVKDTGIGIPQDQLPKVFDRFYQVDSSQTRAYEGSGLGMALAKELIELHHGSITVDSTEGKGTTFTVSLPLTTKTTAAKPAREVSPLIAAPDQIDPEQPSAASLAAATGILSPESHPLVLIVEDNADMRSFINRSLSDLYQIAEATDGKQGILKAGELIPDLIISDVMMPQMDGYQLCEHIKTNEPTCHIPVILLTAKADRESRLTGLETGADDYLSKPFDADELRIIIHNRIEQRRRMRERFSREITLEPTKIAVTSQDEKFITKVLAIIEERMHDENFSIDELSRQAGYSNMQLYRKIKGLSGQTPGQFLRTIRLRRAAELLKNNADNVSQIAYSVGFGSVSYFVKCFREQYGVTPGDYMQQGK